MDVAIDNLSRKLDQRISSTSDGAIISALTLIKKEFQHKIQPFIGDAEGNDNNWVLPTVQLFLSPVVHLVRDRDKDDYDKEIDVRRRKLMRWLSQVTCLVRDVEDVVDTCYLHSFDLNNAAISTKILQFLSTDYYPARSSNTFNFQGALQLVKYNFRLFKGPLGIYEQSELLPGFVDKVKKIATQLQEEAHQMELGEATNEQLYGSPRKSRRFASFSTKKLLESTEIVGREVEINRLAADLLQADEPFLTVFGITGPGGIGKTTLAKAVYERVKYRFDCHAMLFMPQHQTEDLPKEMLKGLLKSESVMAPNNFLDAMDDSHVKDIISRYLHGKRFLLVLDDVPKLEELLDIRSALPFECGGSKILFTSRTLDWSKHAIALRLQPLQPESASELLRRHAFLDVDDDVDKYWHSVQFEAEEILENCIGSPLTIATIGGMISSNDPTNVSEWMRVSKRLNEADYLLTCFADLHPTLKSCFLYAAVLPRYYEIDCKWLQRLWIAEGFVESLPDKTVEEVAKAQMNELVQRNFFQVVREDTQGEILSCWILRPMRDFAFGRAGRHQLCTIFQKGGNLFMDRLLLHSRNSSGDDNGSIGKGENINLSRLYTLVVLGGLGKYKPRFNAPKLLSGFKLLSVLEFQELSIEVLPDTIGNLGLLRYLGLRGCKKLKILPTSLNKTHRLQFLDIRDTLVRDLPLYFRNLKMLRHLLLAHSFSERVVKLHGEIQYITDLQVLAGVKLTASIARDLKCFPRLQKLSTGDVKSEHMEALVESFEQMDLLRSLTFKCAIGDHIEAKWLHSLRDLQKLRVGGHLVNLLDFVGSLSSLKHLYIFDCPMNQDPLEALRHLPNLVLLSLCNAHEGKDICFPTKGFQILKKLSILRSAQLIQWNEIKKGSMPKLQLLSIASCHNLNKFPQGLDNLASLQQMQVINMPTTFMEEAMHFRSHSRFSLAIQSDANISKIFYSTKSSSFVTAKVSSDSSKAT
ncbi:NB-ARC [Dillenia turbinata]|uniref:NB-ARC n=1 Tax=Dillenia turbinata TaxID=194707 RepID=A0AAN8UP50_9MAGN